MIGFAIDDCRWMRFSPDRAPKEERYIQPQLKIAMNPSRLNHRCRNSNDAVHSISRTPRRTIPVNPVDHLICIVRGQKVLLDRDLAALYNVQTRVLNQAVRRNRERFPEDFMFRLRPEEARDMRSQFVIASSDRKFRHSTAADKRNVRHPPLVFTEQGIAMLSSVLRSPRAISVNIEIMRAFVRLRQLLASNATLSRKLSALEKRYDRRFKVVFDAIRELMANAKPERPIAKREIGFHAINATAEEKTRLRARFPAA